MLSEIERQIKDNKQYIDLVDKVRRGEDIGSGISGGPLCTG